MLHKIYVILEDKQKKKNRFIVDSTSHFSNGIVPKTIDNIDERHLTAAIKKNYYWSRLRVYI